MSFLSVASPGRLVTGVRNAGRGLLDLLLPARCQLCDATASTQHDSVLCDECGAEWPELTATCPRCGKPEGEPGAECTACLTDPPPFDRARSLTLYEGKVVEAIQALKYHGRRGLAPLLGRWMASALPELLGAPHYHAIVPIPMHWRRRWWRGYNQAELLARPISDSLGVPLELDITRRRFTQKQARLGLRERRRNMAQAFAVSETVAQRLRNEDVLIIDDVFTTGATTGACALSLKKAGVNRVDVLTLARTP